MRTNAFSRYALLCALTSTLSFVARAQANTRSSVAASNPPGGVQPSSAPSLYDDPRMIQWSRDFREGRLAQVIAAVEQDLRSAHPHPYAAHVWTMIADARRTLPEQSQAIGDETVRHALGVLPDIDYARYLAHDPKLAAALLDRFPAARAGDIRDPWALHYLYYAASDRRRVRDAMGYVNALLQSHPDFYYTADDVREFILAYGQLVDSGFVLQFRPRGARFDTPVGHLVAPVVRVGASEDLTHLAVIDGWLADHPHDAMTLEDKARLLANRGRLDEALAAADSAYVLYPFRSWNRRRLTQVLLQLGRMTDARRLVERTARTLDSAHAPLSAAKLMAADLQAVGMRGAARAELDTALQHWPEDAELLGQLADLELASDRAVQAVAPAERAARLQPRNFDAAQRLLDALDRAGKRAQAEALAARMDSLFPVRSEAYYYRVGEIEKALGRPELSLAAYRRAVAEFPASAWMAENLAFFVQKNGDTREAVRLLQQELHLARAGSWDVARLREWSDSSAGPAATSTLLSDLRREHPGWEELWRDAAAHVDARDTLEAQAAVWRSAIAANPTRGWPWEHLGTMLVDAQRWNEADSVARSALDAVASGTPDDRAIVRGLAAMIPIRHQDVESLPESTLTGALARIDAYAAAGGDAASVHEYRSKILEGLGRRKEAAEEFVLAGRAAPDNAYYAENIVIKFAEPLGAGRAMAELRRYVDRDPYDGTRLRALLHKQVMWYVNPVEALRTVALIKERAPDSYSAMWEGMAWGKLGLAAKQYDLEYPQAGHAAADHGLTLAPSDRYVDWWNAERVAAQGPDAVPDSVSIDFATGVATIQRRDGTLFRRSDHPLSGKPMLRQLGSAWVRAEYDSLGDNLTRVRASSGQEVRLAYDAHSRIDTLTTYQRDKLETTLTFDFNDHDKPVRIGLSGVGDLRVTYKSDGVTIDSTWSSKGRAVAGRVTNAFQELLGLIRPFQDATLTSLPDVAPPDAALDSLRESYARASFMTAGGARRNRGQVARAALALARYLGAHQADRPKNAQESEDLLAELIAGAVDSAASSVPTDVAVAATGAWYDLVRTWHRGGLDAAEWSAWNRALLWLDSPAVARSSAAQAARTLRARTAAAPLVLLPSAHWLPRSYLRNSGFWRRYRSVDLLPAGARDGARLQAVIVRRNHDVVVGTSRGLSVLRRGFWEWFAFDDARGMLSANVAPSDVSASSDVLAVAEDSAATLWVATANGLIHLRGAYDGPLDHWQSSDDGLPTPRVEHLAARGADMVVGTDKGLRIARGGKILPAAELASTPITFLREASDSATVVGTASAVFALTRRATHKLADGGYSDALWRGDEATLYLLHQRDVRMAAWDGYGLAGSTQALSDQQNIVAAQQVYGLGALPASDDTTAVAVLTDLGMSVYREAHFEHVDAPDGLADRRAGVTAVASRDGRTYLLSSEGIYGIELGQVHGDHAGPVTDVLTAPGWGMTFVARDGGLQVVDHARPDSGARDFAAISATHLALDSQGRLLANDGGTVVRFDRGSSVPHELFQTEQTLADGWTAGHLTSILATSDGTVWATAGASLFRWREGEAPHEYSMFVDPKKFPAWSEMLSRVVETVDHRIWVIASDESHLWYRGVKLHGGVVEYDPATDSFHRLSSLQEGWFLSGYTPIDAHTAITGSASGFGIQRGDRYAKFETLKDASYLALVQRMPALFMGTRGAKIGDVWLFGSAGGIVAYREGQWFLPDRINRLLPDDFLASYGSRAVHAIATDSAGRIYAGTDRGLLIYDSGGGDAMGFLVTNHPQSDMAFKVAEQEKLRREADALLANLDPKSPLATQIARVESERQDIERLRELVAPAARLHTEMAIRRPTDTGVRADSAAMPIGSELARLREELAAKERAHATLMTQLERDNLSLYQMLQLNPLDLVAERKRLQPEQAVVQFLPTERTLYIQVVTADNAPVTRQITIARDSLFLRARLASALLSHPAGGAGAAILSGAATASGAPVGRDTSSAVAARRRRGVDEDSAAAGDLNETLAWLYDKLLRPVERDLDGRKQIYVAPVGPLSYVPFAALLRSRQPSPDYAVSHYSFGYLPSMYLLSVVLQARDTATSTDALVMGDPDGTLPGARAEADSVHGILGGRIPAQLGGQATYDHLIQLAPTARVLHLATHAHLDAAHPGKSYLLLADGRRLSVVDIMLLNLSSTSLAVLSACETGLGGDGLEYATLARAFAHAKVPATVASLWRVDDGATSELMRNFYHHLQSGEDVFVALARAQRAMSSGASGAGEYRDPRFWSGFIPFGKPEAIQPRRQ